MLEQIEDELEVYNQKWQSVVTKRTNKAFFESLKAVALGWKVADKASYTEALAALHDQADKIIETWMNERWVAKVHLKDQTVGGGISIIKIMERRPGSEDALGLDHVDFYSSDVTRGEEILKAEPDLKWTRENNDIIAGYDWLSVWFEGTEAKLKSDTVLDIIGLELQELNQRIKG